MNIEQEFNNISNPNKLLEFMSNNINYGYLGKSGRVYHFDDKDFNEKFFDEYILESKNDILQTLYGNCWDQVELERYWFEKNGYEVKTIFEMVKLDYNNNYPTHSFLIFKDQDGSWNWFENSDYNNRDIHKFNSISELIEYQCDRYVDLLKEYNISDKELSSIILTEFTKPSSNISVLEYLEFAINSKKVKINNKRGK